MAKRNPETKSHRSLDEANPRFIPVAREFADTPGFSLMESKTGAMRGLLLKGKSFGMSSQGRFILELNEERTSALVGDGIGKPFRPSSGRVMKGWMKSRTRTPTGWR